MKKYLITTADEITWKFDQQSVFLGEWCRLYHRKHIWQEMDSVVAKPYSLNQSKKDADFLEIRKLEKKLFPEFYKLLNKNFDTLHSERFWQIILGNWFRKALELILNRVNSLKECFDLYRISGTTVYKNRDYSLSTLDYASFENACEDSKWNNILNARIIALLGIFDIQTEYIENNDLYKSTNLKLATPKKSILNIILISYIKIARKFLKIDDAFIINSYLPTKEEIKLEIALGQWPQLWRFYQNNLNLSDITNKPDIHLREELKNKFMNKSDHQFENITRELLFDLLPIYYLEGFKKLKKFALQQPWPRKPKFIFTSNNYESDEIFKIWTASKVESGIKYFVGQHGNNFGTLKNFTPKIEEITADKFLTWGFKTLKNHTPTFIFKTVGQKKKNYNTKGGLVLIEVHRPHRFYSWDVFSDYINYFEDQKEFVNILAKDPKKKLIIRLHQAYKIFKWDEKARWFDFDPSIKIDSGNTNIGKLISKSRLVVHSYDSTGLLETLFQNIPTLAFWQNGFDHLENNAKPFYQKLVDAGIVHLSAKSVSDKVNDIWSDVDSWWSQNNVQEARKQFCECYAKESQNPIYELKKILIS
jgi:putative transferase (TIGR04331 family)